MKNERDPLSTYVIRNLMLTALAYTGSKVDPVGHYFKKYGYAGSEDDLFRLTEGIAIKKGLIREEVKLKRTAWACGGYNLHEYYNTNFSRIEIERLFETFGILLRQNILAPGMYGNSSNLPYFHVTDHGLECIKRVEILPYDYDGYLEQIRNIRGIDSWVLHYMGEAVKCFNSGCYIASTIMIGLSAEKIVLDLIEAFKTYLSKHKSSLTKHPRSNLRYNGDFETAFTKEVEKSRKISMKYSVFLKYFESMTGYDISITTIGDRSARNAFFDYIRLLRNEVSHPSEISKDETESLLLFVSFIKYLSLQTKLTLTFKTI